MRYIIFLALMSIGLGHGVIAQQKKIIAKVFVKNKKALIRWVPTDVETWKEGNISGYQIKKIKWENDFPPDTSAFRNASNLTKSEIKPYPQNDAEWKKIMAKNENAILVHKALYAGVSKARNPEEAKSATEALYGLALLSCDMDAEVAKAHGLYFTDENLTGDEKVAYMISISSGDKKKPKYSHIYQTNLTNSDFIRKIKTLDVKGNGNIVKIQWDAKELKSEFGSYWIERSEDKKNYVSITKKPYVFITTQYEQNKIFANYYDTLKQTGKYFYYRLIGVNVFGIKSEPSNVDSVYSAKKLDCYPWIDSVEVVNKKHIKINFQWPKSCSTDGLKGFIISRSKNTNSKQEWITKNILNPTNKFFIDTAALSKNYYTVYALSVDNDTVHSFQAFAMLPDDTPPPTPENLLGTIDSTGIVKLTWNNSSATDLKGYRVFRCNDPKEEVVEVTRLILTKNSFIDTIVIKTLTKNVYYCVTAVDHVWNNSPYSTLLKIKRPDIIKPVAPIFTEVVKKDTMIHLGWINSSSDDVWRYELQCKIGNAAYTSIDSWNGNEEITKALHQPTQEDVHYTYRIIVADSALNKNIATSPTIYFSTPVRSKIKTLKAFTDREKKQIHLTWDHKQANLMRFIIYKNKKGEPSRIYKTLDAKTSNLVDSELYLNNIYEYRIKAEFDSGAETLLSDVLSVEY